MKSIAINTFFLNWASIQARGLVSWWPPAMLGNTSNSYLVDVLSREYATVGTGNPVIYYDSVMGNMIDYSNDIFTIGNKRRIAGLTNWSIVAWVITDATDTSGGYGRPIYNERSAAGNELLKLQLSDGNVVGAGTVQYIYRDTAGTLNRDGTSVTLTAGITYHIACVKFGTNLKIYIDAIERANKTLTATDTLTTINTNNIGGDMVAPANALWDGRIGDLRLYDYALSAQEIYALYDPNTRWELYRRPIPIWYVPAAVPGNERSQVVIIG